jgi:hypothetical protein
VVKMKKNNSPSVVAKRYNIPPNSTAMAYHDGAFHRDTGGGYTPRVLRGVMGPPGSGKSVFNLMEIVFCAIRQRPDRNGVRLSRWLIVRETYSQLTDSVIKSIKQWYPDEWGKVTMRSNTPEAVYRFKTPGKQVYDQWGNPAIDKNGGLIYEWDGTWVNLEILFRAVGSEDDISKLDSVEFSGAWLNEVGDINRAAVMKVIERVGRYPSPAEVPHVFNCAEEDALDGDGEYRKDAILVRGGCTFPTTVMDLNPPDDGHWIIPWFEAGYAEGGVDANGEERLGPKKSMFIKQPAAVYETVDEDTKEITYHLNPKADNLINLTENKYADQLAALLSVKDYATIESRLMMRYRTSFSGRAVWPMFDAEEHIAAEPLEPHYGTDVLIGYDTSGINPAVVMGQFYKGCLEIQYAAYGVDIGMQEFFEVFIQQTLASKYPGCRAFAICDPADPSNPVTGVSPVNQLIAWGLHAIPAPGHNAFKPRVEAVATMLSARNRIKFSPELTEMVDAMRGKYKYAEARVGGSGEKVYQNRPDKRATRPYSDLADALQYLCIHAVGLNPKHDRVGADRTYPKAKRLRFGG